MRMTMMIGLVLMAALAAHAADWETISGADLSGWRAEGGEWTAQDGVITGRAPKDENCWLIYEAKEFADCEIAYEWRTPAPTNGGVQFRSHWLPRMPLKDGESAETAPRQIYGYQANIETRQRLASGRIICENGRGPLAEPGMDAAKTLKQRDWNTMRIVARGPKIEVFLNDTPACSIEDEKYLSGFIALQAFAFEAQEDVVTVEYRNIRVRDLGREGNWRALFDGKSLDGWKEWGEESWTVEDGAIIGRSGPKKSEGYLATVEQWKNFRVRGSFKMLGDGNFGLFYHSTITLRDDGYPVIAGVQGEVEPSWPGSTGWLYESYKRGWLIKPDHNTVAATAMRPNEWSEIEIRSKDSHVTTWVNGIQVLDFADDKPNLFEGSFALQLHTGGADGIMWKGLCVLD